MNEEVFNLQLRKFLKKLGISSQREIEKAVREAMASGRIRGDETLQASVSLQVPALGLEMSIEDTIALDKD